jgi:hypothetical protein
MPPNQVFEMFSLIMGGLGGPQRRNSLGSGIRIDRRSNRDIPDTTGEFRFSTAPPGGGFVFTSTSGGAGAAGFPGFGRPLGGGNNREGDNDGPRLGGTPGGGDFLRHILMSLLGGSPGAPEGQFGDYVLDNEGEDRLTYLLTLYYQSIHL